MALLDAPHPRDLTDEQWNFIGPFLPELARRKDGRGRPWRENRAVFNGILWILRTGAPWADLPDRYPSYQTCHRRFQQWVRSGVLRSILEVLAQALLDEGYLNLQEAFIDGSFAPAKQGGASIGKTKRGKGSKIMAIADCQGLPVAVHVESATPHEVRLVHATLAERFVRQLPERLIGDNAYESDRAGCGTGKPWRRADRPAPEDPETADARRSPAASLPTEVEDRATFCLAPELSADRRALRANRGELSRHATPCLQPHSLAGFMRWPLVAALHGRQALLRRCPVRSPLRCLSSPTRACDGGTPSRRRFKTLLSSSRRRSCIPCSRRYSGDRCWPRQR